MKKRMMFSLILILCFISGCSQKEIGLEDEGIESEDEEVGFYEKEFQDKSENWEIKLHLIELPVDQLFMEESTVTITVGFDYP